MRPFQGLKVEASSLTFAAVAFRVLLVAVVVGRLGSGRAAVLVRLDLGLALKFLHFGPLVLEPHLDYSDAQARLLGQGFAHFSARLGTDFERGLKLAPLSRRQDGSRPFRTPSAVVAGSVVLVCRAILTCPAIRKGQGGGLNDNEIARRLAVVVVVGRRLDEKEVLFQIRPAEELSGAYDELVAFLKRPAAHETAEAGQVEGQCGAGPHDQLVRVEPLVTSAAFGSVDPGGKRTATVSIFVVRPKRTGSERLTGRNLGGSRLDPPG